MTISIFYSGLKHFILRLLFLCVLVNGGEDVGGMVDTIEEVDENLDLPQDRRDTSRTYCSICVEVIFVRKLMVISDLKIQFLYLGNWIVNWAAQVCIQEL